jgi:hypothetical protein
MVCRWSIRSRLERRRGALALADIAYDVLLGTGILIQPLPIWEEEWEHPERHANAALLRSIDRDEVQL